MNAPRATQVLRVVGKVALGIGALTLVGGIGLAVFFRDGLRTLASFRQVDGYPLFVMHHYGDYHLRDFLKAGTGPSSSEYSAQETAFACTCFSTLNAQGELLLGRNFDWQNRATLLLFTHPRDGYASVSMVDLAYLGYRTRGPSLLERARLWSTPYWPFDGLNEQGLAVGMMAVPSAQPSQDPQKVTVGSLLAMRLVLDYARNVDEALSLLGNYNIDFRGGPPLHYLIADRSGSSAILEFVEGRMNVLRNTDPWQVATNFTLSGTSFPLDRAPCWRYQKAYDALSGAAGRISEEEAMSILANVSQPNTMWSVVYSLSAGDIRCAMGRKYDQVKEFKLEMKGE